MANLTSLLNTIATGRYGRDIRSAIHDAIEQINTQTNNQESYSYRSSGVTVNHSNHEAHFTDLNTVYDNLAYEIASDVTDADVKNMPKHGHTAYFISQRVSHVAGGTAFQIFATVDNQGIFMRVHYGSNSVWGTWCDVTGAIGLEGLKSDVAQVNSKLDTLEKEKEYSYRSSGVGITQANHTEHFTDLDNVYDNLAYEIAADVTSSDIKNMPIYGHTAYFISQRVSHVAGGTSLQIFATHDKGIFMRAHYGDWGTWYAIPLNLSHDLEQFKSDVAQMNSKVTSAESVINEINTKEKYSYRSSDVGITQANHADHFTDLDNVYDNLAYEIASDVTNSDIKNMPMYGHAAYFISQRVSHTAGGTSLQIFAMYDQGIFMRVHYGSWGEWYNITKVTLNHDLEQLKSDVAQANTKTQALDTRVKSLEEQIKLLNGGIDLSIATDEEVDSMINEVFTI